MYIYIRSFIPAHAVGFSRPNICYCFFLAQVSCSTNPVNSPPNSQQLNVSCYILQCALLRMLSTMYVYMLRKLTKCTWESLDLCGSFEFNWTIIRFELCAQGVHGTGPNFRVRTVRDSPHAQTFRSQFNHKNIEVFKRNGDMSSS
jgi:hypothetical protein